MSTHRENEDWAGGQKWQPFEKPSRFGFAGFERVPHELIAALSLLRGAAHTAKAKGAHRTRQSAISDQCQAFAEGALSHRFPMSLWQCGTGEHFDWTLCELIAGDDKGAKGLQGALKWQQAVPIAVILTLCQALSKHLGVKWQILRLTIETKSALASGTLAEIFSTYAGAAERAWELICAAALPLYHLPLTDDAEAKRIIRTLSSAFDIKFETKERGYNPTDQLARLSSSLRVAAELMLDMGAQIQSLQKRGYLSDAEDAADHFSRLSALLSHVCGALHGADLALMTGSGLITPAVGAQLLQAVQLLAEGGYIFADRWLMPLAIIPQK